MSKVERVFPEGMPAAIGPYSPVTIVGDMIFVSGQIALNPITNKIESNDIVDQTHQVMRNLKTALEGADSNLNMVVKTTILLTDINMFAKVNDVYGEYFEKGKYPARVTYAVSALPKGGLIEIDAIATTAPFNDKLTKKIK